MTYHAANPWVWVRKGKKPLRFSTLLAAQEFIQDLKVGQASVFGPNGQRWRRQNFIWFREDTQQDERQEAIEMEPSA